MTQSQTVVIVEAMKMEARIDSPSAGRVRELRCIEGKQVAAGQILIVLETDAV